MQMGRNKSASELHRVEAARQFALRALSVISGCNCVGYKKRKTGSPIRVKITFGQLLRAIIVLMVFTLD
jgi:hypothetical protein